MKKESKYPHLKFPHTQTISFDNGTTRELYNVVSVREGKWVHILCEDGHDNNEVIVNPDRVLFIRVKYEDL
jgi:hypothetical protein